MGLLLVWVSAWLVPAAAGALSAVGTSQANYQYTPDGRLNFMTHPNGVDTDYSYTPQNRVASIEHSLGVTRLAEYAYTYDPDGNRLSETATQVEGGALVQQTRQMAYDLANRLCAVAQGQGPLTGVSLPNCNGAVGTLTGVEETRYAFLGYNRDRETQVVDGLVSSGRVYDYDAANRLSTVDRTDGQSTTLSTLTYGYDPNGNTLSVTDSTAPTETMGFVYNPRDQLVQVTRGPPGAEAILGRYDYDAQGQRIRTEALGALTEEVYDGIALLARYQGGNDDAFVHRGPSGELLGVEAPSTPMHWVHTDVLGSPIVRTDDLGGVVSSTRYGVFGDVALHEESGATPGPRFGFTGHQYDAGTELVYANARLSFPKTLSVARCEL